MKVNGYEIGIEPTEQESRIYRRVRAYYDRLDVAAALEGIERHTLPRTKLTQDEFEKLCHRFSKLDFSDDVWNAVEYEFDCIINERS